MTLSPEPPAAETPPATLRRGPARTFVAIARLALRFGRVERITLHENGRRRETDAEHTVMLGLVAAAFAVRHLPFLDVGRVLSYALVHDLPEVYAGDTPTLWQLSERQLAEKRQREFQAILRIADDMGAEGAWVPETIAAYEERGDEEACYVKAMDKLLPKATHILNFCKTIEQHDMTFNDLARRYDQQYYEIATYLDPVKFAPVFELRGELVRMVFERFWRGR